MAGAQAPGGQTSSTVISFAQKTFANGNLTSKLHVIELGAAPGAHGHINPANVPQHPLHYFLYTPAPARGMRRGQQNVWRGPTSPWLVRFPDPETVNPDSL